MVFRGYDLITTDGIWKESEATAKESLWKCEPVSHELFKTALCLPCDVSMTEKEQDIIIEIILSCYDEKNLNREAWEEALGRIS